jgi:putative transposase
VRRRFKAARPGQLHVADFTYVQMVTGRFTSVHFTETLLLAGLAPSIGTVGDALDNTPPKRP